MTRKPSLLARLMHYPSVDDGWTHVLGSTEDVIRPYQHEFRLVLSKPAAQRPV